MKEGATNIANLAVIGKTVTACVLGGTGGALAYRLGFPAPWLVGSTIAVAMVSLTPLEPGVPAPLRNLAFVIIGASLGSGVDADTLAQASKWSLSLAMMLVGIPVMMAASYQYLHHIVRYDRPTAILAASPGGLSATMAMAAQGYGDIRQIALIQCFRLLFLTAALPHLIAPLMPPASSLSVRNPDTALPALAAMLALALACGWLADRARIPAAFVISGVLVSAVLHASGIVAGGIANWIMAPVFIVIGAVVGSRFVGFGIRDVVKGFRHGLVYVVIAGIISGLFAFVTSSLLGLPLGQVWVAFAPGGLEVMAAMALAFDFDPAFVAIHHLVRIICLAFFLPIVVRKLTD
ncbi:MAG: AbrB family transcriptional regulator [Alphaproteobacteria bacterium]|nr:MAG: AbrB family transcriptional regulator [Alphaproteobacteria bacterium]